MSPFIAMGIGSVLALVFVYLVWSRFFSKYPLEVQLGGSEIDTGLPVLISRCLNISLMSLDLENLNATKQERSLRLLGLFAGINFSDLQFSNSFVNVTATALTSKVLRSIPHEPMPRLIYIAEGNGQVIYYNAASDVILAVHLLFDCIVLHSSVEGFIRELCEIHLTNYGP